MKSPVRSPQAPGQGTRGRAFDRHSATGSRGLPKKNGAGGKGVWGAMLDQEGGPPHMDKNDPNYDSDDEAAAAAAAAKEAGRTGEDVEPPVISLTGAPETAADLAKQQAADQKDANAASVPASVE